MSTSVTRREVVSAFAAVLGVGVPRAFDNIWYRADGAAGAELDIARLLRLSNVPSLALTVVNNRRITSRAQGVIRTGAADPATPDTVYAAASLTKTVFAFLVLGLVVDGLLSLDTPVREYLALPDPDDARAKRITIRHLLGHTSGWRNWRFGPTPPLTSAFEPGSQWSYSGEGYFFLQRVVERVTGSALGTLARERIFGPLGMSRSAMMGTPELLAGAAIGHNTRGEPLVSPMSRMIEELHRIVQARGASLDGALVADAEEAMRRADASRPVLPVSLTPNAAASMVTSANDFGLFLRHLITARRRGGRDAQIVSLMFTPQVRLNEALHWGLGVGLEAREGRMLGWQWGDNPGFKNFVVVDPARQSAMAVFTNGDRGARVYEKVLNDTLRYDLASLLWN